MKALEGKVAVITGGTSGIGLATARRFVAEGAHVYITGRRQNELDEAVGLIGHDVTGVRGDVSNLADIDRLVDTIKKAHATIDIYFANAGWGEFMPIGDITEEHFDTTFDINVKGVVFGVQKALPLIRDGGSIIVNASIAGFTGQPAFSIYAASKAAVRSLARTWTTDLKERRIRVNAISPGVIPTPAYDRLGITEGVHDILADDIPLGRVGLPEEIAAAVVFLASGDSSFITGIDLVVDGGQTQV
jgi:NAD(P)-dependent dehydrogenase (short-subunit alcohol dehydrogenase family)